MNTILGGFGLFALVALAFAMFFCLYSVVDNTLDRRLTNRIHKWLDKKGF